MATAGVVLHQFDELEDPARNWAPCPKPPNKCTQKDGHQVPCACAPLSDRMSATIVAAHPRVGLQEGAADPIALYRNDVGGVVLAPEAVKLFCGYTTDGGTRNKRCSPPGRSAKCTPGCADVDGRAKWCDAAAAEASGDLAFCVGLPWHPDDLAKMLGRHRQRGGYSEIVIDSERWEAMLPDAIEAFFYPVTGECALDTRCQIHTRAVHQAFLYHYSLDEAQVPLLKLHPQATGAHWDAPFDVDGGEWAAPGAHQADARARISEG